MYKQINRKEIRQKKHSRIRKNISGMPECPRLVVFRSAKHMYAQVIDDTKGVTLVAASTAGNAFKDVNGGNIEAAKKVGLLVAERALEKGIKEVVFDRGGMLYHGRIAAVADGAREGGLQF